MSRRLLLILLAAVTVAGCGGRTGARDTSGVPDEVMLQSEDLDGAQVATGGPDQSVHPIPPRPCGSGPSPSPSAERLIKATFGRYQVYEYVARYPAGLAERAVDDLRGQLSRCVPPADAERYQVLAQDSSGVLFLREYHNGDATAAYYLGHAESYLVAVLEIGTTTPNGDPTIASDLGRKAVTRAGGMPGTPRQPTTPAGPARWTTYEAEVTGVRRGPDPRTLLVDVVLIAGHPECARNPRVDQYTEENTIIHANVVFESARAQVVGGCPEKAAAVATLTAPQPIGERIVVLNQQAWAPEGSGYRRCDPELGCHPPADHCDPAWIRAAISELDVPRHSYWNTEHCDAGWLIVTVDVNSSACGAGGRPGCSAPPAVTRYFLRFDTRWRVVAGTTAAGCAAVLRAEPSFPRNLCERLPATR